MAGLNHQVRGKLGLRIRCALPRAQFIQIIPIKMKRAISVRKVIDMMATVRNASPAGRRVIACLARCDDWNRFWLSARANTLAYRAPLINTTPHGATRIAVIATVDTTRRHAGAPVRDGLRLINA